MIGLFKVCLDGQFFVCDSVYDLKFQINQTSFCVPTVITTTAVSVPKPWLSKHGNSHPMIKILTWLKDLQGCSN